jgi:peptide/nickel transport system permease protein
MLRFIVRRMLSAIPVFIIGTLVIFLAIRSVRDPVAAANHNHVTGEALERFRHDFGLDTPWYAQYLKFLWNFVRLDFGTSLTSQGAVLPSLRSALANSLVLGVFAAVFYVFWGLAVGIISAVKQYSLFDHLSSGLSFVGLSLPPFFFGLVAIFAVGTFWQKHTGSTTNLLPLGGLYKPGTEGFHLVDRMRHLILPALTLAVQEVAIYSRYMRTAMLENMNADYLRTARAKGISERRVIFRHAFRNALIPVTTFSAIDLGAVAGGLIITESIFGYPGMGTYFLDALARADFPELMAWSVVVIAFVVAFNVLADISYAFLDPRIRVD